MKYTYAYKTRDGTRHEAKFDAPSRETAFAALRARGIRPIKVVAADGSKANGELRGVRKRVMAAAVIGAAVVAGVAAFFVGETNRQTTEWSNDFQSSPRHQIYGDPALMEEFARGKFEDVLTNRIDQMLAWFAQPGKLMCPKGTNLRLSVDTFTGGSDTAGRVQVVGLQPDSDLAISPSDPREVRELKQIVNGMREEMRTYLANGNGTPRSYWRRLLERTQQEMQIYERTRRELENEKNATVWEEKNEALRRIGLRTIPNPKDGDE